MTIEERFRAAALCGDMDRIRKYTQRYLEVAHGPDAKNRGKKKSCEVLAEALLNTVKAADTDACRYLLDQLRCHGLLSDVLAVSFDRDEHCAPSVTALFEACERCDSIVGGCNPCLALLLEAAGADGIAEKLLLTEDSWASIPLYWAAHYLNVEGMRQLLLQSPELQVVHRSEHAVGGAHGMDDDVGNGNNKSSHDTNVTALEMLLIGHTTYSEASEETETETDDDEEEETDEEVDEEEEETERARAASLLRLRNSREQQLRQECIRLLLPYGVRYQVCAQNLLRMTNKDGLFSLPDDIVLEVLRAMDLPTKQAAWLLSRAPCPELAAQYWRLQHVRTGAASSRRVKPAQAAEALDGANKVIRKTK